MKHNFIFSIVPSILVFEDLIIIDKMPEILLAASRFQKYPPPIYLNVPLRLNFNYQELMYNLYSISAYKIILIIDLGC